MSDAQGTKRTGWLRENLASEQAPLFVRALVAYSAAALFSLVGVVVMTCFRASLGVVCVILSAPLFGAATYFRKRWEKWSERLTVEEALKQDPRPPILYLRPFKADKVRFSTVSRRIQLTIKYLSNLLLIIPYFGRVLRSIGTGRQTRKQSAEEFLVSLVDPLGPVIAIGRPKEATPPLGAARMYLGDEWKDVVHDLMKRSQLILMFAGNTPHFAWELQRVFQNDPFVPTILVLPFFQRYRQREVDLFVSMFEATTGLHLSKDLRKTRAAFFPHAAEIVEIHELNTSDERALNELNPFLGPIAQIMELGRPGWTDGYIEFARENRQSNRRWIFAGATALLLLTSSPFWVGHWTDQKAHETEIAEQFFADEIQGTNPCTDPKLSKLIPDSNECFKAILRSYVEGADICKDPSLAQVFPDSGTCGNAMQQAYLRRASIGNK